MALRRPILLICIATIVLGINFEVTRFSSSDSVDFYSGIYVVEVSDGFILRADATGRERDTCTAEHSTRKRRKRVKSWIFHYEERRFPGGEDIDRKADPYSSSQDPTKYGSLAYKHRVGSRDLPENQAPEQGQDPTNMKPVTPAYCRLCQQQVPFLNSFLSRMAERSLPYPPDTQHLQCSPTEELQLNGSNLHRPMETFTSTDENEDITVRMTSLHDFLRKVLKQEDVRSGKETMSKHEHNLSLVCLCITLMIFRNGDLKQKVIMPLFNTFLRATSIRQLIMESLLKTSQTCFKGLSSPHLADKEAMNGISHNVKTDHFHFLLNKDKDKEVTKPLTNENKDENQQTTKASSWLTDFTFRLPRSILTFNAFPISFLPSMGSSPQDKMSHLGCRLASLSSLPASCDISRVRLAEAGFYYNNSKTNRDANNIHEMTCYSCGFSYSQWKSGDNPITIHQQLKPDCSHLHSINNTTPSSTPSMSPNETPSLARSSGSSGYGSMNDRSSSLSDSSMSSGNPSYMSSLPSLSMTSMTDSAMNRNMINDLATDSAAILPHHVNYPTIHTSTSRPAGHSVTLPLTNQGSFLGSHDASHTRMSEFDERPPLSMHSAVYPQFCRHQERLATFSNWPLSQSFPPENLVMQGFYYAGYEDCIRCFYCGVGLKSWNEGDDVMREHIRWRSSCGYVLNTKGRRFVNGVLEQLQISSSEEQNSQTTNRSQGATTPNTNSSPSTPAASSNSPPRPNPAAAAPSSPNASPAGTTSPASSAARPGSSTSAAVPPAAASSTVPHSSSAASASSGSGTSNGGSASKEVLSTVQDMGFDQELIARAVRQLQQSGITRTSVDALVEKILEMSSGADETNARGSNATEDRSGLQTDGAEVSTPNTDAARAAWLVGENKRLRERQICKICNNAKVGMIFLPCGHILACNTCGSKIKHCSRCGEHIRATANVYL